MTVIKINDVIDNIDCTKYICMIFIIVTTSWPYFGVKLSCVCLGKNPMI